MVTFAWRARRSASATPGGEAAFDWFDYDSLD